MPTKKEIPGFQTSVLRNDVRIAPPSRHYARIVDQIEDALVQFEREHDGAKPKRILLGKAEWEGFAGLRALLGWPAIDQPSSASPGEFDGIPIELSKHDSFIDMKP